MLHQALCALDDHLGNSLMTLRKLVESRIENFHVITGYRLLYVRNLLRTLVDQQNDDVHIGMVDGNRLGHLL